MAERGTTVLSKIVLKSLGSPAAALSDENINQAKLGVIMGRATGIKTSKAADQMTIFKGLAGSFEAIPADEKRDITRSGVCFLGNAFDGDMIAAFEAEDAEGNSTAPDAINFAFEIWVQRAKNAAGYSWALKPLIKEAVAESDPLAEIRKQIAGAVTSAPAAPQLEAPAPTTPEATPAPVAAKK